MRRTEATRQEKDRFASPNGVVAVDPLTGSLHVTDTWSSAPPMSAATLALTPTP